MRIVIDRFEGSMAVLDVNGHAVNFPASALPEGAREGSVLTLALDAESEREIRERAEARLERLRARSGGDEDDTFEL